MKIAMGSDFLIENELKINEYIILYLIWKKETHLIPKICDYSNKLFDELQEKGWMKKIGPKATEWIVRDKFLNIVTDSFSRMWNELCSKKPFKVPNGRGGYRMLRAKDPDARSNSKAKDKYRAVVGKNPTLHKTIIKCLDVQMRQGDLQYMQNTETWIHQKTWEKYQDLIEENEQEKEKGYGTGLI